jgi:hypothetical protein
MAISLEIMAPPWIGQWFYALTSRVLPVQRYRVNPDLMPAQRGDVSSALVGRAGHLAGSLEERALITTLISDRMIVRVVIFSSMDSIRSSAMARISFTMAGCIGAP